jgi:hypothetical protein
MSDHVRRHAALAASCVCIGILSALLLTAWALSAGATPQAPGVQVGPDHTREAEPGQTVTYQHTLTNTGTTTDTFLLAPFSTQGWPVALIGPSYPSRTLQVGGGMTASFQVSLTVPLEAAGVTEVTLITATSGLSPTVKDTAVDTTIVYQRIYLPFVARRWPPIPYPATLNPIENADGNGFYSVTWPPVDLAQTYSLEEDDNSAFSSPIEVYNGTGTSWAVPAPGKAAGTYYYRVRGHNTWGYGAYSNVQAVTVLRLRADHTSLTAGECTTLRWEFTGIRALYISFGYGYDKEGVAGQGSRQVCPSVTTTYEALVVRLDNSQETHRFTVNVSGSGCGDPVIQRFAPSTYHVYAGEPFSVFWDVECADTVHLIQGDGPEEPVVGHGSKTNVTINANTVFKLKVEKNSGGFVYASFTVYLR